MHCQAPQRNCELRAGVREAEQLNGDNVGDGCRPAEAIPPRWCMCATCAGDFFGGDHACQWRWKTEAWNVTDQADGACLVLPFFHMKPMTFRSLWSPEPKGARFLCYRHIMLFIVPPVEVELSEEWLAPKYCHSPLASGWLLFRDGR
jgi:hypothetical protein